MKKNKFNHKKRKSTELARAIEKISRNLNCVFCGKRITQKIWDSQEPYVLDCFHSLGGEIGSYGDYVFNATFCSRQCIDDFIRICRDFNFVDWLIGSSQLEKKPIKTLIKREDMMKWLCGLADKRKSFRDEKAKQKSKKSRRK